MMENMRPAMAWRALLACDQGGFNPPLSVRELLAHLDDDMNCVNACRAIINASGVLQEPLPYDGACDDAYKEAIRALASAAGVDEEGHLPTQTNV